MNRLVILASVVALAATSANCGSSDEGTNPVAPSDVEAARGGSKGKPGGGGSGSLTLVMVTDSKDIGVPNWGDRVRFDVSTTATTEPNVSLTCSQNGVVVYGAVTGYYEGYPWPWTQVMTLSSNTWQGGRADCTAKLYYFSNNRTVDLASKSFTAYE
jgi:hypothetical protein